MVIAAEFNYLYKIGKVRLSDSTYTYNGKKFSPTVIVENMRGEKLVKGKDYSVTIPNNRKDIGIYRYIIKFKGNYTGTRQLTLTIKPVKPIIRKPKTSNKTIIVKWKKRTKYVSGYQIMLATNKNCTNVVKKVLVKDIKRTYKKISKLKSKNTYYVKVRVDKVVKQDGRKIKIFSDWSQVKKVKL